MRNYLGRMVLLVRDYEIASQFYEENFGFQVLFDQTTKDGQRFLHLGDKENNFGIWFLKAEGKEQEQLVGNQTGGQPALVINTSNIQELYKNMKSNEVKIKQELESTPEYTFFHCFDNEGNELVVTELQG
ncbi:putative enzyme related to lactoylglutathione lyase [Salegentibacter sp. 24]|uniref:VOC family protein n=1 Tax=Salegentibacter sp. 24 TaxID=2183986 RepID=UPI0010613089|nr:VOC family protein [Salegentibacter sp. 24]TDN87084.1 putative enzyme related to lactoylglutathione lyase [Salegentibacter sp. 24]